MPIEYQEVQSDPTSAGAAAFALMNALLIALLKERILQPGRLAGLEADAVRACEITHADLGRSSAAKVLVGSLLMQVRQEIDARCE